jgi:hypothetical protein
LLIGRDMSFLTGQWREQIRAVVPDIADPPIDRPERLPG